MKEYFILGRDERYGYAPTPINFFFDLNPNMITGKEAHKIPKRTVLEIEKKTEYDGVDLIAGSLFLVSDAVRDVFSFYDDEIFFKIVVLTNDAGDVQMQYNLPIFEDIECFHKDSEFGEYGVLRKMILDRGKLRNKSIFRIKTQNKRYVVVRLDVAESLLRRNLKGLSFTETEVR
jgi:hypothetical protein